MTGASASARGNYRGKKPMLENIYTRPKELKSKQGNLFLNFFFFKARSIIIIKIQ